MSQTEHTAEDVLDSLSGFDEIAIATAFGHTVAVLVQDHQSTFARALVFILKRRDGLSDVEAYQASMEMPLKAVLAYFAEDSEESGKDEPVSEPQPESLQPSAS